jgi:3-oxoacyl-[acyl-carrier-protein] synthase-3
VQDKLGARHAVHLTLLQAVCFIYSLVVASQMIATGVYENILVIGAETFSKFTDWTDRNTCVVFGDGAEQLYLEQ